MIISNQLFICHLMGGSHCPMLLKANKEMRILEFTIVLPTTTKNTAFLIRMLIVSSMSHNQRTFFLKNE